MMLLAITSNFNHSKKAIKILTLRVVLRLITVTKRKEKMVNRE